MTTQTQRLFELDTQHYADFDRVINGALALREVFDVLGAGQQRDILAVLLPGVLDVQCLWTDLQPLLDDYDRMDGVQAVSDLQERGQRFSDAGQATQLRLDEIALEIRQMVRRARLDSAEQIASRSVERAA